MTALAPEVGTVPTRREVENSLELQRRAVSQEILSRPGTDLADMTEAEFENGIKRVKTVQARMKRILDEALTLDVHYGRELQSDGKTPVFKKDRLKKAGAEEIRRLMKLTIRPTAEPIITAGPDWVSVIVQGGIYDAMGRLIALGRAACNTKEKRFKKFGGSDAWTYKDAREELHSCLVMAEKRLGALLTSEASGATGWFADGEAMEPRGEDDDDVITPWTEQEKKRVYDAAGAKSIGRRVFGELVADTLGRTKIGTGEDVRRILEAIAQYVKPATRGISPLAAPDGEPERPAPVDRGDGKRDIPAEPPRHLSPEPTAAEREREELSRMPDALRGGDDDLPF